MALVLQRIGTASPFLRKRTNLFLLAVGLMTIWLIVFGLLFREHNYFLPGPFVWLIFTSGFGVSVWLYRLNGSIALNKQA
ncbi:MAG: hypothetical protein JSU01_21625 [Bacteroidetes bacterium]|nr:hypothetical protein [Bacteroidota bacterium]